MSTIEERSKAFQDELTVLLAKYGLQISAPYQHNIDGLTIQGSAPIRIAPDPNWKPPQGPLGEENHDHSHKKVT